MRERERERRPNKRDRAATILLLARLRAHTERDHAHAPFFNSSFGARIQFSPNQVIYGDEFIHLSSPAYLKPRLSTANFIGDPFNLKAKPCQADDKTNCNPHEMVNARLAVSNMFRSRKQNKLPPIVDQLLLTPAHKLSKQIKDGSVSGQFQCHLYRPQINIETELTLSLSLSPFTC